jgi:prevent-host-death family protein
MTMFKCLFSKFHSLEKENMSKVSVAMAKSHLSELIAKSSFAHERFIITRRNKPVAALVSLEDLQIIEQYEERQGLASITGKWKGFEEVSENLEDIHQLRNDGGSGRNVSL